MVKVNDTVMFDGAECKVISVSEHIAIIKGKKGPRAVQLCDLKAAKAAVKKTAKKAAE